MNDLKFSPPSQFIVKLGTQPGKLWFTPSFNGWENIPDHSRILFVGNHTIFGLIDIPLLANEIYQQKNLFIRGMADRIHFKVPVWRSMLSYFGAVEGSRQSCTELMTNDEPVLVFPGGGREVCKRKGEAYSLIWKKRAGFAKLAAQHNYTIIPFAAVGAEDCYDILWDANDWQRVLPTTIWENATFNRLIRNGEGIMPIARGIGPFPKRVAFKFSFCPPINTTNIDAEDDKQVWQLREQVKEAIELSLRGISEINSKLSVDNHL